MQIINAIMKAKPKESLLEEDILQQAAASKEKNIEELLKDVKNTTATEHDGTGSSDGDRKCC